MAWQNVFINNEMWIIPWALAVPFTIESDCASPTVTVSNRQHTKKNPVKKMDKLVLFLSCVLCVDTTLVHPWSLRLFFFSAPMIQRCQALNKQATTTNTSLNVVRHPKGKLLEKGAEVQIKSLKDPVAPQKQIKKGEDDVRLLYAAVWKAGGKKDIWSKVCKVLIALASLTPASVTHPHPRFCSGYRWGDILHGFLTVTHLKAANTNKKNARQVLLSVIPNSVNHHLSTAQSPVPPTESWMVPHHHLRLWGREVYCTTTSAVQEIQAAHPVLSSSHADPPPPPKQHRDRCLISIAQHKHSQSSRKDGDWNVTNPSVLVWICMLIWSNSPFGDSAREQFNHAIYDSCVPAFPVIWERLHVPLGFGLIDCLCRWDVACRLHV